MKYVIIISAMLLLWLIGVICIVKWTIQDGKNRHLKYEIWVLLNALFPVIGLLIYSMLIRRKKICRCRFCGEVHSKKDEHCPNCGATSSDEDILEVVGNNPAKGYLLIIYAISLILLLIVSLVLSFVFCVDFINSLSALGRIG